MSLMLMGTKLGMTRVFVDGKIVPVTVLQLGPCVVTQVKTQETDGYNGVQLGFADAKIRTQTIPEMAHDAKAGTSPKLYHREFRVCEKTIGDYELGQVIAADAFEKIAFVDVTGTSKGKGFAGGMKRYGFKGQQATHGVERKHRSPGSIGGHGNNAGKAGRIKKGKHMAGHMGDHQVTVRSLPVVRIDAEQSLMLVKGPVPGCNTSLVQVRCSTRLYRSKATLAKEIAEA